MGKKNKGIHEVEALGQQAKRGVRNLALSEQSLLEFLHFAMGR